MGASMVGMTSEPFFARARGRRIGAFPPAPAGSAGVPGRVLALFVALSAGLGAAFVYAPRWVAASTPGGGFADQRTLIASLRDAFGEYWGAGSRNFAPPMRRIVDYWFRYHVAKAVVAALLVGVLVTLCVVLWRTYLRTGLGAWGKGAIAAAWGLAATLALVSVALVAANIQGAVAPFSSLLSMLPAAKRDGRFAATLDQVRQGLAHYSGADNRTSPALRGMVDDFALYHVVVVVVAAVVALVLIGMSVLVWRRFARAGGERRARRAFATFGVASLAASLIVLVIAAANLTTVAAPAPALLAFFQGGW